MSLTIFLERLHSAYTLSTQPVRRGMEEKEGRREEEGKRKRGEVEEGEEGREEERRKRWRERKISANSSQYLLSVLNVSSTVLSTLYVVINFSLNTSRR